MNSEIKKTRVTLDHRHSLDVSVSELNRTVIAELITDGGTPSFIYAEKFDTPCNYLRTAIKKGIVYLDRSSSEMIYNEKEDFVTLNA